MIDKLIEILCLEKGKTPPENLSKQHKDNYFRSLCNVRPPVPISDGFLALQDQYLQSKTLKRGVVDVNGLEFNDSIALWQGDISRLNSDAIVNACNSALLGCFHPLHNCIDNIIHTYGGVQIRRDCHTTMQGGNLANGDVVVTPAYNLPSNYIFHTVGPIVENGQPKEADIVDLSRCYRLCIEKAGEMGLETLAFCCLSTGVYGYPKDLAAKVAVEIVREYLPNSLGLKIIFNVFLDEDKVNYERELSR